MICLLSLFLLTEKGSTVTGFLNLGDEFDFKCQLCGNLVTKEERRLLGVGGTGKRWGIVKPYSGMLQ